MAVARCVFPTPLEPIKIMFVLVSMKRRLVKSAICSFLPMADMKNQNP